jgi:hypothetical protein
MPDDRDRLLPTLRRALFMWRLRRQQEEDVPPGTVPHLNLRERRLLRAMLRRPEGPWTLNAIWYAYQIAPPAAVELGEQLSTANLAFVRWSGGVRCLALTEFGIGELPAVLALYQSTRPLPVLLRRGPRAAAAAWLTRRRDRAWRRRQRRQLRSGEARHDDNGLLW